MPEPRRIAFAMHKKKIRSETSKEKTNARHDPTNTRTKTDITITRLFKYIENFTSKN